MTVWVEKSTGKIKTAFQRKVLRFGNGLDLNGKWLYEYEQDLY